MIRIPPPSAVPEEPAKKVATQTLGGHIFAHDALRLDYCLDAAVNSLLPVCDEVVVMDCASTDGTLEMIKDKFGSNPKVRIYHTHDWHNLDGTHGKRLRDLAHRGRDLLTTEWQFMLQADEVLHEMSYPSIREAMASGFSDRYVCRRVDLWGDVNRCLFLNIDDYSSEKRPMEPKLVRLAKKHVGVFADAGELLQDGKCDTWSEQIVIYHYSMVRDPVLLMDKIVEMHTWYHNQTPEQRPDDICVRWWRDRQPFDHRPWKTDEDLRPIPYTHPESARDWVARHPVK